MREEVARKMGIFADIEREVSEMMKEENLKIEYIGGDGKWTQ
jgi:hypothetical protein